MTNLSLLKNRYKLIRELGGGGMGIVYEAHDELLDRPVAVKVLSENSQSRLGSEGRSRLLHEAQAAARLNHPNIVGIYDAGEDQGTSFIVMELVEGESLYDHKPQLIDEVIAIGRQISDDSPRERAIGSMPPRMARAVMITGRRRRSPPVRTASSMLRPRSRMRSM